MELLLDFQNTVHNLGQIFSQKLTLYVDKIVELKLKEMIQVQSENNQQPINHFKQEDSLTLEEKQNNEIQQQQVQELIVKKKRQSKKRGESKTNKKQVNQNETNEINNNVEQKEKKDVKQKSPRTVYNVYLKERIKQLAHLPPGIRRQQCISDWKKLTEAEKYVYYLKLEKNMIQVKKEMNDQKQINQFFQNQTEQKKIQM